MLESLDFTWDSNTSASIVRKLPATPDRFLQRAMAVINHRFASIAPSTAVPDGRYIDNFDEKEEAPLEVILPAISPDSMMNKSMRIFEWCPVCYVWNGSCCESRCWQEESIYKTDQWSRWMKSSIIVKLSRAWVDVELLCAFLCVCSKITLIS